MRKFLLKTSSLILALALACMGLVGCAFFDNGDGNTTPKLPTPEVVIGYDGVAVWGKIDYAMYYIYVIDGGAEMLSFDCSVKLEENESIKVKAVSKDTESYRDSDFSKSQKYIKATVGEHDHTDLNDDGLCDRCGNKVTVDLSFYAVNDLHGKFMDTDSQEGVDEFTTFMKELYEDDEREEILLSSGDMWQGTVESSSNKGQLMCEWMNDIGFVSMTLGNHEYDWGAEALNTNSELASFPFLAINVTYNNRTVDYCQASTVVERGGIKIGIIGAIGDCLSSISGDYTPGLKFATGSLLTSLVIAESQRLRTEEKCDFIVYSIHDGGEGFSASGVNKVKNKDLSYYDTELSDGFVDLVFEGHTHQSYILQDEYGVYHIQGGGENRAISCAEVSFNTVNGGATVTPKIISSSVYADSSIDDDPIVGQLFSKYFPQDNPYTTVLGYNRKTRGSSEILTMLAQLYYERGIEEWGNQYSIVLGGGYLNARSPYQIPSGNVTYANIFSVLPFDNEIVLGKVTGWALKNILSRDNYTCYATVSENEVVDSQYYYIIVDSYSSTYKYNNITEVARLKGGVYPRDLLADFVSAGGWS